MKVYELIQRLCMFPPGATVYTNDDGCEFEVESVGIYEEGPIINGFVEPTEEEKIFPYSQGYRTGTKELVKELLDRLDMETKGYDDEWYRGYDTGIEQAADIIQAIAEEKVNND
jgi:hypothetical protein